MTFSILIVLYILCAAASAFFSLAETAITSLSEAAAFRLRNSGERKAQRLERLRDDLPRTIGTFLVGNTLANAAAGSLGAGLAIAAFGEKWGVLVATVLTSVLLLVVAEVTPKTIAARRPEQVALLFVGPMELFVRLLAPVTRLFSAAARWILGPFGADAPADVTEDHVKSVIDLSREQGGLKREESELLHAVLAFGQTPVREAMVPRARIVLLPVAATFLQRTWATLRMTTTLQLSALYAVGFGGFVAFSVYLPTYLRNAYELSAGDAASRTAGFVVLAVVARPVGGWLSDRLHPVPVLGSCFAAVAVLAGLAALELSLMPWATIAFLGLAAALGASSGACFALVARVAPAAQVGSVTGVVGAAGGLGGFVPPLLMGVLYGRSGDYTTGYVLLALVAAAASVYTLRAVGHADGR